MKTSLFAAAVSVLFSISGQAGMGSLHGGYKNRKSISDKQVVTYISNSYIDVTIAGHKPLANIFFRKNKTGVSRKGMPNRRLPRNGRTMKG